LVNFNKIDGKSAEKFKKFTPGVAKNAVGEVRLTWAGLPDRLARIDDRLTRIGGRAGLAGTNQRPCWAGSTTGLAWLAATPQETPGK
jgi:hypothetical protein